MILNIRFKRVLKITRFFLKSRRIPLTVSQSSGILNVSTGLIISSINGLYLPVVVDASTEDSPIILYISAQTRRRVYVWPF